MAKRDGKQSDMEGWLFGGGDFPSDETSRSDAMTIAEREDYGDLADLFLRLGKSTFRSRFHLKPQDIAYVKAKGVAAVHTHAVDFVLKRLVPAFPCNDGKQTPMRGHPVFIAQHATGCCCRGCLAKWHGIAQGRELTVQERNYVVHVLMGWISREMDAAERSKNLL